MREPTRDIPTRVAVVVRVEAAVCSAAHLPRAAAGDKVSTALLVDVLLHAAATGTSVEAACDTLLDAADANTVRAYLNDQLGIQDLLNLEHWFNRALGSDLPRKVRRAPLEIAIDLHDQPLYAKSEGLRAVACRGEARAGTTHFIRIATAYVIQDGVRLTLALAFVRPTDALSDVVTTLLDRIAELGLRVRHLWLDRGFAGADVVDAVRLAVVSAVIAWPIRGKRGGTRGLCRGRGSAVRSYTVKRTRRGDCTVSMAVVRLRAQGARKDWMLFALVGGSMTPRQARERYRRRFGVESSYRQMRQVRIRTNSRNPVLRFVYLGIALILVNLWTLLRFRYCQVPGRGRSGRPLDPKRFMLRHLAAFLRLAIELARGVLDRIQASVLPRMAESVVY